MHNQTPATEFAAAPVADLLAAEVAQLSPSAIMLTKYLLYQIDAMSFEQAIRAGVDLNVIARLTPDCQTAVRKFLSKAG